MKREPSLRMTDRRGTTVVNTSIKQYLKCYLDANGDGYQGSWKLTSFGYLRYLARRPGHMAAAEQVDVQVVDGLSAVWACIDDQAIAVG